MDNDDGMKYSEIMQVNFPRGKIVPAKESSYLILADNHPEIHAIVQELSSQSIPFLLVSNLVIKPSETKKLLKIFGSVDLLRGWIQRRSLRLDGQNFRIIRVLIALEILIKVANQLQLFVFSNYLTSIYKFFYRKKTSRIIAKFKGKAILVSEAIEIESKPDKRLITIAFHGSPNLVNQMILRAKDHWKNWSDSEKLLDASNTAIEHADHIIALSNFSASGFESSPNSQRQVHVIPIGGINLNHDGQLMIRSWPEVKTFLYLGRLSLAKGLPVFVESAESFSGCAQFIAAGNLVSPIPGWPEIASSNSALRFELAPSTDRVKELFRTSHFYISPSYYEGFGIAAIEAMSFGCIPILSKYSAAPEILANSGLEKFIFDPEMENSLHSVIDQILNLTSVDLQVLSEVAIVLSKKFSFNLFAQNFVRKLYEEFD